MCRDITIVFYEIIWSTVVIHIFWTCTMVLPQYSLKYFRVLWLLHVFLDMKHDKTMELWTYIMVFSEIPWLWWYGTTVVFVELSWSTWKCTVVVPWYIGSIRRYFVIYIMILPCYISIKHLYHVFGTCLQVYFIQ